MRHFRSILYALVLAPAVWVLTGAGLTQDLTTRGRDDFAAESVTGLLLLVLAGAAYAILLLSPISPAGPLFGGLAFLGVSAWALISPGAYAGVWPEAVAKESFDISRPGYGLAALLAVPLICTALSARRWARYEPPALPLIGIVGRPSGDTTEVLRLPVSAPASDDTTTVLSGGPSPASVATIDADATTLLPSAAGAAAAQSGSGAAAASSISPVGAASPLTAASPSSASPLTAASPSSASAAQADTATPSTPSAAQADTSTPSTPSAAHAKTATPSIPSAEIAEPEGSTAPDKSGSEDRAALREEVASREEAPLEAPESGTVADTVAALAAEEPFKIGEVVDVAPEDEATIAVPTLRDERRTTVVVSWDEAATVAALCDGQASTKRATVTTPPAEPEVKELLEETSLSAAPTDTSASAASADVVVHAPDADTPTDGDATDADATLDAEHISTPTAVADAANQGVRTADGVAPAASESTPTADKVDNAASKSTPTADEVDDAASPRIPAADDAASPSTAKAVDPRTSGGDDDEDAARPPALEADDAGAAEVGGDGEVVETYVVGRAAPAPESRGVPPELEKTRSLEAPDPDRTRAISLRELTTKLQITPGADEVNEPVRARASVAAPDPAEPDLSGAEVTRSLSAPDPDRTRTIQVVTSDTGTAATGVDGEITRAHAITVVTSDDAEVTRPLNAPDPDATQAIALVAADDAERSHGTVESVVSGRGADDGEVTRALDAPDPERTQVLAPVTDLGRTRDLDQADPERTHGVKVPQLAAPLRLAPPAPAAELVHHPGRAPGHNTAALSHTGDIGGDETQVIGVDPDRTQILGAGTVEPPGERTEILRIPVRGQAAVPAAAVSIADAESPNFAEDPTSPIVPPGAGGNDDSEPEPRGVSVMSMERAPGDEPEIPAQRGPS